MGCGCNKNTRSVSTRTPTRGPNTTFNSTPEKITDTVPLGAVQVSNNRMEALDQTKASVQAKYMNPERLRIERLRRDAIRKALGKE